MAINCIEIICALRYNPQALKILFTQHLPEYPAAGRGDEWSVVILPAGFNTPREGAGFI